MVRPNAPLVVAAAPSEPPPISQPYLRRSRLNVRVAGRLHGISASRPPRLVSTEFSRRGRRDSSPRNIQVAAATRLHRMSTSAAAATRLHGISTSAAAATRLHGISTSAAAASPRLFFFWNVHVRGRGAAATRLHENCPRPRRRRDSSEKYPPGESTCRPNARRADGRGARTLPPDPRPRAARPAPRPRARLPARSRRTRAPRARPARGRPARD